MPVAILSLALLCVAAGPVLAVSLEEVKHERHRSVEALPELARIGAAGDTIFILRGRLSENRAKQTERIAREVHQDVKRRFLSGRDKSGLRPVDVCVFESSEAYRKFAKEVTGSDEYSADRGFFVPYRRLVVVDLGRGVGGLRHELVHGLLRDEFGTLPDWLDEGLAALYVTAKWTRKGYRFQVNFRLRQLRAARAAGSLPDLEELAASDDRDVYGANYEAYYSLARYLLLYLERQGRLEKFFAKIRSAPGSEKGQLKVLKQFVDYAAFLKWTDKLDIDARVWIEGKRIKVGEKIRFLPNKHKLIKQSQKILLEVADLLKDNPKITRVRIEGHTAPGDQKY